MRIRVTVPFLPLLFLAACGGSDPGNEPPIASDQSIATTEDLDLEITLSGSDSDGSVASYEITSSPGNGTLEGDPPLLTYTPNDSYYGEDSFSFTVTDNEGATSAGATVSIEIHWFNDLPVAHDISVSTTENTPITILLSGSDDDGTIAGYHYKEPFEGGSIVGDVFSTYFSGDGDNPEFEYVPYYQFSGVDTLEYLVQDDAGDISEWATVTITVEAINDPPVLHDQWFRLINDENPVRLVRVLDPEGLPVTLEIVSKPTNGEVQILNHNRVRIDLEAGFIGESEFVLASEDEDGNRSRDATMTVTAMNSSPNDEKDVLGRIFDDTDGEDSWITTTNWKSDTPIDSWFGVTAHSTRWPDRVHTLDLTANGLTGELGSYWAQLAAPMEIRAGENSLSGELPPHLTDISIIQTIDVSNNELTGELPRVLISILDLEELDVRNNQISGSIPDTLIGNLRLRSLRLGDNEFSGYLVPEHLPKSLRELDLSGNQFQGALPASIDRLSSLTSLSLEDSGLSGRLPHSLIQLTELSEFRFSGTSGDLCAPLDIDFQVWLNSIPLADRDFCNVSPTLAIDRVYLTNNVTTGITNSVSKLVLWNFGDSALELTISTADSWITISDESISLLSFGSVEFSITIDCGGQARRVGVVTITSNDPNREEYVIPVDVRCLNRNLSVAFTSTPEDAAGGPTLLTFPVTLSFQLDSDSDEEYPEPYTFDVSVPSNDVIQIPFGNDSAQTGLAYPGVEVSQAFNAECKREGSVTATATVTIGTINASVGFNLSCDPDTARVQRLTWYQVPEVAREVIAYDGYDLEGGVKDLVVNTFTHSDVDPPEVRPIPRIENRDAVVAVLFAHAYDAVQENLIVAQWEDLTEGSNVDLVQAVEPELIEIEDPDSTWKWGTEHFFHLSADQVVEKNSPVLLLQVESMASEFRTDLLDLQFSDAVPFSPVFLPYTSSGGAGDPAPDWDDDELLLETREWMPLAIVEPGRTETMWFHPSSSPDVFDVLDWTSQEYNLAGEAGEFYHGLLLIGWNGYDNCFGASGVAYLSGQTGASCIWFGASGEVTGGSGTVAHEFGHNWSLRHVACSGGEGGPDPAYPYAGGTIGPDRLWSYEEDSFVDQDYFRDFRDFMTYCSPEFTSDHSYGRAADYFVRRSVGWQSNDAESDNQSSEPHHADQDESDSYQSIALMLRLQVESGEWEILQAQYSRLPPRQGNGGTHELVMFDLDGVESHRAVIELLSRQILLSSGEHVDDWARTVIARVPIPSTGIGSIEILDDIGEEIFSADIDVKAGR